MGNTMHCIAIEGHSNDKR